MKLPSLATIRRVIDIVQQLRGAAERQPPKEVRVAIEGAPEPEELARWRVAGGGVAPAEAPHIPRDGGL